MTTGYTKKYNISTTTAIIVIISLLATPLVMATTTYSITPPQIMAYAQEAEEVQDDGSNVAQSIDQAIVYDLPQHSDTKTLEIQSAPQSEGAAHTGTIDRELTVDPENREGDEPALHREMTKSLPNDRIIFRVVESAPQSSNAAAQAPDGGMINQNTGQLED